MLISTAACEKRITIVIYKFTKNSNSYIFSRNGINTNQIFLEAVE